MTFLMLHMYAMQELLRQKLIGIAALILVVVATTVAGFAHRAPDAQDRALEIAALQGLDVAQICHQTGHVLHGGHDCPACHPVALPPAGLPAGPARDAGLSAALHLVPRSFAPLPPRPVLDPARGGMRAPPVVPMLSACA